MTDMHAKYLKLAAEHTRRSNIVRRKQALPYVALCIDDALSVRSIDDMPDNARLVGWQCGFEPMFVAVWSCLGVCLTNREAESLAVDLLQERKWFSGEPSNPDYII